MKIKFWSLPTNSFQISVKKITKPLLILITNLVILFVLQVPVAFGQGSWVWSLTCNPDVTCWDQDVNVTAQVNFQAIFTNLITETQVRGWASTTVTCPNGASVQNNAMVSDQYYFFVDYEHWANEMNGFNQIFMTLVPGSLNEFGIYTPAGTLYFPELCSAHPNPPHGGGGCLSSLTTSGEIFKEGESADICSPCDPDPTEIFMCQQGGGTYDFGSCQCGQSPIVIDVLGNGFNLTNAQNGVNFDINGDGTQDRIAWSSTNSDDAWLSLDRNGNGTIDSGKELFGNSTEQPAPSAGEMKNGFLALAEFDKLVNGGNADGKISQLDAVFANLRLWQDTNHNGVSEANELKTLSELGLAKINLDYQESRRTDEYGNRFRYKARVRDTQDAQLGRWAWDVYLVVQPPQN